MRIALVAPCVKNPDRRGVPIRLPQLSLAFLASMTPDDVDVTIYEDLVDPIDFDEPVDLVGITLSTKTAVRAYEIAREFRARGRKVVLGGIHPTVVPHEASRHADAIVLGEAEGVWSQLLADCRAGKLEPRYQGDAVPSLETVPKPSRHLFRSSFYHTTNTIQASRGCPYDCLFCSVSTIYGRGFRTRPVDEVIGEVEDLSGDVLFFVDDNIVGIPDYSRELLTRLVPLGKRWFGQASIRVAFDDEILKLLQRTGCVGLLIGFETSSPDGLRAIGKGHNTAHGYEEAVRRLHDHGVQVLGSFIVGLDSDDVSRFDQLLEFTSRARIDVADIHILTPYPGTKLYEKLKLEGRLLDDSWWLKYDPSDVVFMPKLMTREELLEGWLSTRMEIFKLSATARRWLAGFRRRTLFGNSAHWKVSMAFRKSALVDSATLLDCGAPNLPPMPVH